MLNLFLIAIPIVIVLFILIIIATRPDEFCVTRSAGISAPAAAVFGLVNDLHNFQEWSPWARLDPDCRNTYAGPPSGAGAAFSWAGNNKVGEGSLTIIESRPGELVRFNLEFLKPFKATHTAEFTFKSEGDQTVVTWSMFGKNNFMGKAMGLIINCDKMVGGQFESGLSQMKILAEAAMKAERVA